MERLNLITTIDGKKGVHWVKYYDKTAEKWEEGILLEPISNQRNMNMWRVYFPSTFMRRSYFLAMEVKTGEPEEDYCAYRYDLGVENEYEITNKPKKRKNVIGL